MDQELEQKALANAKACFEVTAKEFGIAISKSLDKAIRSHRNNIVNHLKHVRFCAPAGG